MIAKETEKFVKLKNPYTFGIPVRGEGKFFGREKELQLIFDTLNNVPRGQKQDMVVLGPRRIGKSSLLYRLNDLLVEQNQDFVPVYVDVQNIKPRKTHILFLKILREINKQYKQKNLVEEEFHFDTLGSNNIPADLEFFTFDEDLERLNKLIANRGLPRLVLIFDEVELLVDFGGRDILDWFRSLIQSMSYCTFVVAGSKQLYALTQDYGSPFYNIFKIIEIFPLSSDAAKNLVEIPAKGIGLDISAQDVAKILDASGNSPYFIQGIAHYLVERLNEQQRTRVYQSDVDAVIKACAIQYLSSQFSYFWGGTSSSQKVILYQLAQVGEPKKINELVETPLLGQLKPFMTRNQEWQDAFDDLVLQQILQVGNEDNYWFMVPMFALWIQLNINRQDIQQIITVQEPLQTHIYDTAAIRQLLTDAFDDEELTSLAFDYFRPVYEQFTSGMTKSLKIQLLLDYTFRHSQTEKLLEIIRQLRPYRYESFFTQ